MRTILKYTALPNCEILMPMGAEIIHTAMQDNNICLWAMSILRSDSNGDYLFATKPGTRYQKKNA